MKLGLLLLISLISSFALAGVHENDLPVLKRELTFSGEINKNSVDRLLFKLDDIVRENRGKRIHITLNLNSGGGEINQTIRAVNHIRDLNYDENVEIDTKVSRWSDCESACTIFYTAGEHRIANAKTQFGFHSPKFQSGPRQGISIEEIEARYRVIWLSFIESVDPSSAEAIAKSGYLNYPEMQYFYATELNTGYVTDIIK